MQKTTNKSVSPTAMAENMTGAADTRPSSPTPLTGMTIFIPTPVHNWNGFRSSQRDHLHPVVREPSQLPAGLPPFQQVHGLCPVLARWQPRFRSHNRHRYHHRTSLSNWVRELTWADQSLLGVTSALRPTLVNDFRYSYFFFSDDQLPPQQSDCPGCLGIG